MKSGTPSGKSANSSANKALGTPLPSTSRGLSPSSATHTSLSINGELPNAVAVGSNYYYSDDIWMTNDTGELLCSAKAASKHVFLDVLLPTGFLVPVQCPICRTFSQLKTDIYIQAKRLPVSARITDISNYIFTTIGLDGIRIELYDEQKQLSCLQNCLPILELIEPEGNLEEKILSQKIGTAMGFPLSEIEKHLTDETDRFRLELFDVCKEAAEKRGTSGTDHYAFLREPLITRLVSRISYRSDIREVHENDLDYVDHPEDLIEIDKRAMERLRRKIEGSEAYMELWYRRKGETKHSICVKIRDILGRTPVDIIALALNELRTKYRLEIPEDPSDFILQIAGRRVFLANDERLTQFEYVRSCLENYRIPKLILRRKEALFKEYIQPPPIFEPTYVRKQKQEKRLRRAADCVERPVRSFWDLDENLRIRIQSVTQMIVVDVDKVFVRIALAVGHHVLDVKDSTLVSPSNPRWQDGLLEFGVYLKDIPESAQLSFSLISVRTTKSRTELVPLGWINCRLFDWNHRLIQGKQSLHLWPFPKGFNGYLNLDGMHGSNFNDNLARIVVEFSEYSEIIEFPDGKTIEEYIRIIRRSQALTGKDMSADKEKASNGSAKCCNGTNPLCINGKFHCENPLLLPGSIELERLLLLRRCLDASRLSVCDQEFLWSMRHKIRELFPQTLVVLAECSIVWCDRERTCEFYALLDDWPDLRIETAIELLDGKYVDRRVRQLAVEHLDRALNDDQFQLYLLVLVQAVRYESYASSPLADLLVRRSLLNFRIGHPMFWLLRVELTHLLSDKSYIKVPYLYIRYALILEAICRGNAVHLDSMIKQVEMISTLTTLSTIVQQMNGNKELTTKKLQQELEARKDSMQNMNSPLNPADYLGELVIEECRVLGSAKMPLRLTWRNPEFLSQITTPTHQLIFKNGDDMRQDMLTLQVMRIMDSKWKSYNRDYCMTLYEVLPMGKKIGLIHVVQNCQTLFEIQCDARQLFSSLNMDVELLNKYIYKRCSDSKIYMECVDRFAYSLAGYCIATYVIGIKDRHQDNIMVAEDGRIFHIDFGHFLGHTKRKLGINRERTDFILTEHFLLVVARGKSNYRQTHEFSNFRDSCVEGFMIVHHHARFYIALFRMMLSMGLPELSTPENVDFLKSSLMYDEMDRKRVSDAFQDIFEEVIKGDWFVSINWFFHSVKHI